ncbi:hypothetical protein NQ317_005678 [Molorchus minor]|uniref:Uncharacterized protein n=1 Tax=Molorchus minor TaxID=1323400 RepID=A0ABQ9J8S5_9CUCU|nr:hypothetical protein NQ317_005678 [Molorchus minor]
MSFNNGSTINRKGSVDSASRKENFNKLRNIFEIKRPSKSPNSTLRKSKSIPSLISPTLEDERGFSRENIFMRSNSTCPIDKRTKHRKGSHETKHNTRKGNLDIDNCSLYEAVYQEYSKKTDDDNNFDQNPEIEATEVFQMLQSERKYRRNNTKYYVTSPYNSLGRKAKAAKEKRESRQVKSFIEADQKGANRRAQKQSRTKK